MQRCSGHSEGSHHQITAPSDSVSAASRHESRTDDSPLIKIMSKKRQDYALSNSCGEKLRKVHDKSLLIFLQRFDATP